LDRAQERLIGGIVTSPPMREWERMTLDGLLAAGSAREI
jgi:hypothetical protein